MKKKPGPVFRNDGEREAFELYRKLKPIDAETIREFMRAWIVTYRRHQRHRREPA